MAIADFDGDGRLDFAINNNNAQPSLFDNRLEVGNWLRLALVGSKSNRDAVGAKVRVAFQQPDGSGSRTLTRWVEAGSGYASQSAFPLHFGLGEASAVTDIEITWPSGRVAQIDGDQVQINRALRIEEGAEAAFAAAMPAQAEAVAAGG